MTIFDRIDAYLKSEQTRTPQYDWERWNALAHARQLVRNASMVK